MFWCGLGFFDMLSDSWLHIDMLHDYICLVLIGLLVMVGGLLANIYLSGWVWKEFVESSLLEFVWTLLPVVVLIHVGYYSFLSLYSHELDVDSVLTVKVTGHQWYWSYDYSDFEGVEFDSYMVPLGELLPGQFRLLEVDNHTLLPVGVSSRFLVTSADVLHSWAVPSVGLKIDANPGRLNMVSFSVPVLGLYYGQCSEICGANHSFMPICVEVTSLFLFKCWVGSV